MENDNKTMSAKAPARQQMVCDLAHRSGANVSETRAHPGAMCQQGQGWSNATPCFPQKFVQLVGYRDPNSRPASRVNDRPAPCSTTPIPADTPIG